MEELYYLKNGNILKIIQDDYIDLSPRDWDNLGTMVCWHSKYNLGDDHDFISPVYFDKWLNSQKGILLPLYLYDHSGITMNTTGFSCRWDSGHVGWIYVLNETILKEYNIEDVTPQVEKHIKEYLKGEVETYNYFISGQVYGFILEDNKGTELDSCWGFYGPDIKTNGILDHVGKEIATEVMAA